MEFKRKEQNIQGYCVMLTFRSLVEEADKADKMKQLYSLITFWKKQKERKKKNETEVEFEPVITDSNSRQGRTDEAARYSKVGAWPLLLLFT